MRLPSIALGALAALALALPARGATYNQIISCAFGAPLSGQAANVLYTVVDSGGTTRIASTGTGVAEATDAAAAASTGLYRATVSFDTTWAYPVRVKWTITGQTGVCAEAVVGSDRAMALADGYTAAAAADLDAAVSTRLAASAVTIAGGYLQTDVHEIGGAALGTASAGYFPADLRLWGGAGPNALVAGYVPGDIYRLGGAALGTASAGYFPADLRLWGGAAPSALASGRVDTQVGAYASGQDPATLLLAAAVDGTLTVLQQQRLELALALDADRDWNPATHTAVLTWYRRTGGALTPDRLRPVMTKTTVYAADNVQVVSQSATVVRANL